MLDDECESAVAGGVTGASTWPSYPPLRSLDLSLSLSLLRSRPKPSKLSAFRPILSRFGSGLSGGGGGGWGMVKGMRLPSSYIAN